MISFIFCFFNSEVKNEIVSQLERKLLQRNPNMRRFSQFTTRDRFQSSASVANYKLKTSKSNKLTIQKVKSKDGIATENSILPSTLNTDINNNIINGIEDKKAKLSTNENLSDQEIVYLNGNGVKYEDKSKTIKSKFIDFFKRQKSPRRSDEQPMNKALQSSSSIAHSSKLSVNDAKSNEDLNKIKQLESNSLIDLKKQFVKNESNQEDSLTDVKKSETPNHETKNKVSFAEDLVTNPESVKLLENSNTNQTN